MTIMEEIQAPHPRKSVRLPERLKIRGDLGRILRRTGKRSFSSVGNVSPNLALCVGSSTVREEWNSGEIGSSQSGLSYPAEALRWFLPDVSRQRNHVWNTCQWCFIIPEAPEAGGWSGNGIAGTRLGSCCNPQGSEGQGAAPCPCSAACSEHPCGWGGTWAHLVVLWLFVPHLGWSINTELGVVAELLRQPQCCPTEKWNFPVEFPFYSHCSPQMIAMDLFSLFFLFSWQIAASGMEVLPAGSCSITPRCLLFSKSIKWSNNLRKLRPDMPVKSNMHRMESKQWHKDKCWL